MSLKFYICGFCPCFCLRAERKTMICCDFQHKTTKSLVFHAALDKKGAEFLWNMHNIKKKCLCSNRTTISLLQFAPGGHLELMVKSWYRGWEATRAWGGIFLVFRNMEAVCQRTVILGWPSCWDSICQMVHQVPISHGAQPRAGRKHMNTFMKLAFCRINKADEQINEDRPGGSSDGTNWCRHRKTGMLEQSIEKRFGAFDIGGSQLSLSWPRLPLSRWKSNGNAETILVLSCFV